MNTILHNGKVYVERGHFEQAVLIAGNRITVVGSNEEVLALRKNGDQVIDLGGKTLIPGINDTHQHMLFTGEYLLSVRLLGASSLDEVIERGKAFLQEHPLAPGQVLTGQGWNQDYFSGEKRFIDRHDLDRISTEVPIIFDRACGHVVSCNTKTLELAGIDCNTPQPQGGGFDVDENGNPNGIFKELNGIALIKKIIPAHTPESIERALVAGLQHAVENGITSVHSMECTDNHAHQMAYDAIIKLEQEGRLPVRINEQVYFNKACDLEAYLESDYFRQHRETKYFRHQSIKSLLDGSLGGRTALMRRDYSDAPGERGLPTVAKEEFFKIAQVAARHQMQVVVHGIGDDAISIALDAFETCNPKGMNPLRNGIIHCQITDLTLINRIRDNDIYTLVQPIFLNSDLHIVDARVGKGIARTSYAFHTMKELGVHVSYGTDCPVEDLNPFENIYSAVARKDLKGCPENGFYPEECVDIYDAVDACTLEGAFVSGEEKVLGRIEPGRLADLTVVSQDIFTIPSDQLKNVKAELTMMDGQIVFQR